MSQDAGQSRSPPAVPPRAAEGHSLATDPSIDTTIDAFLAGISARAFRFAELGLRHREDALDAVQDAMMKMMGYRDRPATEWTPLFWSILRRRIVDMQRRSLFRLRWMLPSSAKTGEDGESIDWADTAADDRPDPSGAHDQQEAYRTLVSALRALPARQREAFTLRVLEDCDVATTARIMGCSEGSVKTHLFRARDTLQKQLEDFR
ncbi:MAG: RNA polymerase sigma factor [Lysobacter sp.]|nr:RNA polymerase sigma factor [Lysobacter sp.]